MIILPCLPSSSSSSLFGFKRPFQIIPFFLITSDFNRHFGATSASLRKEDRASIQPLCSQAIHRLLASFGLKLQKIAGRSSRCTQEQEVEEKTVVALPVLDVFQIRDVVTSGP